MSDGLARRLFASNRTSHDSSEEGTLPFHNDSGSEGQAVDAALTQQQREEAGIMIISAVQETIRNMPSYMESIRRRPIPELDNRYMRMMHLVLQSADLSDQLDVYDIRKILESIMVIHHRRENNRAGTSADADVDLMDIVWNSAAGLLLSRGTVPNH